MEETLIAGRGISTNLVERKKTSFPIGFWLVAAGAATWGLSPLLRSMLLQSFTSMQIVLLEHVLLLFFAAPIVWKHRSELVGLKLRHVGALLFISWGGSAIATIMFTNAFIGGNLNAVLLLQKMQPIFAILMARLILKEMLPARFPWFIALALAGTYLLTFGWSSPFQQLKDFAIGSSLLSLGAAAIWGGSTVMGRLMLDKMQFKTVTALRFLLALPLLITLTSIEGASWNIGTDVMHNLGLAGNLLGQAFIAGLLGLLLYYKGLSGVKASYATLAELSFPAVGLILNWLAFGEHFTASQFIGFTLIWLTLFLLSRQEQQGKPQE